MTRRKRQDRARGTTRVDRRADRGFSLTEVVIAIALIGVVVLGMLEAIRVSVAASSLNRAAAQVETAVVNAADRVNRAPKRCDYTVYAQAAVQTQGWPAGNATVEHEYYLPGANASTAGTWQTGTAGAPGCPGQAPTDLLVQRITITITNPDGDVRRSIQVVKSDV